MSDAETIGVVEEPCWCTKCGYSLQHQPMTHEPHYGLLIAMCPECATVRPVHAAAVSRTLARGLGFARVSWFFFCCLVWVVGCGLAWAILAYVVGEAVSWPFANKLSAVGPWYQIAPEDVPKMLATALPVHGMPHALRQPSLLAITLAIPFAFVSTAVAIVGISTISRKSALVLTFAAIIAAIAGTVLITAADSDLTANSIHSLRWKYVGGWIAGISIFACSLCAFIGLWFMRSVARWFLMLVGDPVMQLRAARLWTMDGKKPPQGMTRQS